MQKTIIRSPNAISDIIDIATFIAKNNQEAAERFLSSIDETFELLRQNPLLGAKNSWMRKELQKVRMVPVKHFLII